MNRSWYVERTDTHEREDFTNYREAVVAYERVEKDVVLCRGNGTLIYCK